MRGGPAPDAITLPLARVAAENGSYRLASCRDDSQIKALRSSERQLQKVRAKAALRMRLLVRGASEKGRRDTAVLTGQDDSSTCG